MAMVPMRGGNRSSVRSLLQRTANGLPGREERRGSQKALFRQGAKTVIVLVTAVCACERFSQRPRWRRWRRWRWLCTIENIFSQDANDIPLSSTVVWPLVMDAVDPIQVYGSVESRKEARARRVAMEQRANEVTSQVVLFAVDVNLNFLLIRDSYNNT